ncbi:MAG: pyrrolidone-carboxylate peptidase [Firmicutes bacterium]|nr:pyrrolidone-carboxylate peptidase [Bacillota bacterium]
MKKVLVTGFEPFGGEAVNPALEAIKLLEGKIVNGAQIIARSLPVAQKRCIDVIVGEMKLHNPELVLAVGQAGGRCDITVERVAVNIDDFRIPDNDGNQPVDEPIVAGGPIAYYSTLPIKAVVEHLRTNGIPASVSNTAGTFVCNHLFYGLMHTLAQEGNLRRGGFVHIPYLPEQAARLGGQPSMALDMVVRGLEAAVSAALVTGADIKLAEGKIC